ncbi:MAG: FMN-binding protein [Clostridiales bacterium]|nr:FMN-binding protein [Candidatus Cacconaster stercorequi]
MKISGKFILKVAGTLTAISLVVAALLGVVNNVTKDQIAAINLEKTEQALAMVAPEGATFEAVEIPDDVAAAAAQYATVSEIYTMSTGGYATKIVASGSQGNIEMIVGVDADGAITGVSIVSNAETGGIGSKVMDNKPNDAGVPVLDQFVGLSGAGSLVVKGNITPISGATVSTNGVTAGANAALAAVEALG